MKLKKDSVILGAFLLSASSVFVRMIGFFFRVYLAGAMGAEGMGLYSMIMSVYSLCATVATSGISTAVSKLAAEELARGGRANARRVLGRAVRLAVGISSLVGLVVFVFAGFIGGQILGDPRTVLSLRLLAPGMPCLSVSACLRGYFIAGRRMGNPASAQILEQLSKMAFIMALMRFCLPLGIEYGAALVVLGITLGEAVCFLYSLGGYLLGKKRRSPAEPATVKRTTRSIMAIAMPISMSGYARSSLRLLEDVLIMRGLRAFSGRDDIATGLYGMLRGMVMPILIFPLSLLSAFVVTLTPEISRIGARNNPIRMEKAIHIVLRFTSIIGVFIVGVFMTFSYELGVVVYKDPAVGEMLARMAFLCPFMCLETAVVAILQGLGEQLSSMRYSLADCVLRVALVYALIPLRGARGFVIMVVASNLFTSLLNLARLMRVTRIRLRWREWLFRPLLATLAAGQGVRALCDVLLFQRLLLWQGLLVGLALMAAIYLAALVGVGSLGREDLDWAMNRIRFPSKPPKPEAESPV